MSLNLQGFGFFTLRWCFMSPEGTDRERVCGAVSPLDQHTGSAPVIRRYQPQVSAMAELVEVLHRLLLEVNPDELEATRQRPKPTCFSGAPE